jgi:predicted nucleic acid-binding protein
MIARVYVDTSVIGGCLDEEFAEWSLQLVAEFHQGRKRLVLSELTIRELAEAPLAVREIAAAIPSEHREILRPDTEVLALADAYIEAGVVAPSCVADAQHIAAASVARVDVLVSWNFRHIVNLNRIRLYNSVNLRLGYGLIDIRTPREVLDEEDV